MLMKYAHENPVVEFMPAYRTVDHPSVAGPQKGSEAKRPPPPCPARRWGRVLWYFLGALAPVRPRAARNARWRIGPVSSPVSLLSTSCYAINPSNGIQPNHPNSTTHPTQSKPNQPIPTQSPVQPNPIQPTNPTTAAPPTSAATQSRVPVMVWKMVSQAEMMLSKLIVPYAGFSPRSRHSLPAGHANPPALGLVEHTTSPSVALVWSSTHRSGEGRL